MKTGVKIASIAAASVLALGAGAFGVHAVIAGGVRDHHSIEVSAVTADGAKSEKGVSYDLYQYQKNGSFKFIAGCSGTTCVTGNLGEGDYKMVPMGEDAEAKGVKVILQGNDDIAMVSADADDDNGITAEGDTLEVSAK